MVVIYSKSRISNQLPKAWSGSFSITLILVSAKYYTRSRPYHSPSQGAVGTHNTPARRFIKALSNGAERAKRAYNAGGPDELSSLHNNHMTILHSSLHKYILAVHDLHCIPRYISTYIHIVRAYNRGVRHWRTRFRIYRKISRFQQRFQISADSAKDFKISAKISDFLRISRFQRRFQISRGFLQRFQDFT